MLKLPIFTSLCVRAYKHMLILATKAVGAKLIVL